MSPPKIPIQFWLPLETLPLTDKVPALALAVAAEAGRPVRLKADDGRRQGVHDLTEQQEVAGELVLKS